MNVFAKVIADETRQRILEILKKGEKSVSELTACFSVTQPTISHHLAILRKAKLVISRRDGKQVFYRNNLDYIVECCQDIMVQFQIQTNKQSTIKE
jgi:DNA-binding transcriptional ArsR family regulator